MNKMCVGDSPVTTIEGLTLLLQQILPRRPSVWVDCVEYVACVVVDATKSANDAHALIFGAQNTGSARVVCTFD